MKLVLIFIAASYFHCAVSKIVTIKDGQLNGTVWISRNGKLFNAFLGIPFALPPVGELRYNHPIKSNPWNGTLNASKAGNECIQISPTTSELEGSEDCLSLNVYTPINATKGDKLPVIVYIFGGKFTMGNITQNGPHYFMNQDIVMIQPSYRLGALGFLSTGDNVLPGNIGLWDQILALQWVKENIEDFGGDPNEVTLMGHSSGAACAHLHTVSPHSKGLFNKVILQSSVGGSATTIHGPDVASTVTKMIAVTVGCNTNSSQEILNCLKNTTAEVLVTAANQLTVWDTDPEAVPRPCVEGNDVKNPFLADFPQNMEYHSPDQPWIIGTTSEEAAYKVARYLSDGGVRAQELNSYFRYLFPIIMQYYWTTNKEDLDYVTGSVKKRYLQNKEVNANVSTQLVRMISDGFFEFPIIDVIRGYPGPKYAYMYNYHANYTTQNDYGFYPVDLGVSHSAEVHTLFLRTESFSSLTEQDKLFGDDMILRWVNFAKSGNPNFPEKINKTMMSFWKPVSTQHVEYLRLNINGSMEKGLFEDSYLFWKSLPTGNKYKIINYESAVKDDKI